MNTFDIAFAKLMPCINIRTCFSIVYNVVWQKRKSLTGADVMVVLSLSAHKLGGYDTKKKKDFSCIFYKGLYGKNYFGSQCGTLEICSLGLKKWLSADMAPSHFINQCWLLIGRNVHLSVFFKIETFHWINLVWGQRCLSS